MSRTWLNVSDIVASPEFTQTITVKRHGNGRFVNGRYKQDTFEFNIQAVVSATDEQTLQMVPEGDRADFTKTIHTLERIYMTDYNPALNINRVSDTILYNGDEFKVVAVLDADDYGFTKAVISKLGGS